MDNRRGLLPSEVAAADEKAKKAAEERAALRVALLRGDFSKTFSTEHGKRVLQWLRQRCGHNKVILSANSREGTIDPLTTTFAAMELNLYLTIREFIPNAVLKELENDGSIDPSGTVRTDSGSNIERKLSRKRKP